MTQNPLKPAEYLRLAREIEASLGEDVVRLGVLSTFTAELLRPFVAVECRHLGCPVRTWFGAFGQLEQAVFDDHSALWQHRPDVLWIALRLEDVDRHLIHESPAIGPEATRQRLDAIRARLIGLARAARTRHRASILVSNLAQNAPHDINLFDANDPDGFVHLLAECNRQLAQIGRASCRERV
jgi:hypothetical protein